MKIQLHTPFGIVEVDSDTITDLGLSALGLGITKKDLSIPRDIAKELDELKDKVTALEKEPK